ncbi:MAG: cytosine deaminase [Hyphomicrobiales bacterium]|nr:MAG: cytosine deaminase [Hyphomicrobiales bacterium]
MIPAFKSLRWPEAPAYVIRNARVPLPFLGSSAPPVSADAEGLVPADLHVAEGKIAAVVMGAARSADGNQGPSIDLGGRQVWPGLVDLHTHLDKAHTIGRSPNPDGTFNSARLAATADRPLRSHADIVRRMDFGLRAAYAHGVAAIRSHLDTYPDNAETTWAAASEMAVRWTDRITLQLVSLCPIDLLQDAFGDHVAALVAAAGGVLGGVTRSSLGPGPIPEADLTVMLDRLFALAARHDLDVDLHVDESGDPNANTLPHVARAALRHGYAGRVTCGHCCSLAVQPEAQALATLDLLAEARISIVTLPTVNMYLQDRVAGRTPRWRGVTLVRETRQRGILVAAAGDNCRDSFYAYGDHDMVDTFRQAVRILHLDHPISEATALVGPLPARIARLAGTCGSLEPGMPARLIAFNARSMDELIARPQSDRVVIDAGKPVTAAVPDYSELWDD